MKKAPTNSSTADHGCSPQDLTQQADFAREVIQAEVDALSRIEIDDSFHQAVDLILTATTPQSDSTAGAVVISGIGKSGLIGQKLSATFASTGAPSHYLHATEAMHGDLGRIRRGDVVLLLSFGGNTEEVVSLASLLKQDAVPIIALVGKTDSDLARLATVTLTIGDVTEACPLNLAPTASTTAMLALGDALALAVSRRRNFGVDDFRKFHPGGSLGRQLTAITDAMRLKAGQNLPLINTGVTVAQAMAEADKFAKDGRRPGALLIVDDQGKLAGIFTDGDLARLIVHSGSDGLAQLIDDVMTRNPKHLQDTALVRDAVQLTREGRFDEIPIVSGDGKPVGLIDVQDLVGLKVIEG